MFKMKNPIKNNFIGGDIGIVKILAPYFRINADEERFKKIPKIKIINYGDFLGFK